MEKRIIINADDFGLCEGVNKAIEKAHKQGVLTSATIMTNMPAADQAVKIAKQLPALGVGVHLNLLEGPSIAKNNSVDCLLDGNGRFNCSPPKLSLFSIAKHKFRNAIRAELAAQIQWLIDKGLEPTHLDSHKHIHSFPAIFPIVCELARRFHIPAVRWTFEPKQLSAMPWPLPAEGGKKRAALIRVMATINRIQNSRFLKTDALLGIAHTGKIDVHFLKAVTLYNPAQTAEVMTHPGFAEGLDNEQTRLMHQREIELDALCNEKTKQYFNDAGIKLVHYGKI
ncbi:MAG: carbohydrate deacetylase [Planctomycetota bacterium]|jgi:hopanoid biosynthesis associated protein HpnK